jgi:hypothetical protein
MEKKDDQKEEDDNVDNEEISLSASSNADNINAPSIKSNKRK